MTLPQGFPAIDTGWLDLDDAACLNEFLTHYRARDYSSRYSPPPTAKELVQYGVWLGLLWAADAADGSPDPTPPIESFGALQLQLA